MKKNSSDKNKDIVHGPASFQYKQHVNDSKITHIGEQMALFPLPPRFSKMLLLGLQQDNLNLNESTPQNLLLVYFS